MITDKQAIVLGRIRKRHFVTMLAYEAYDLKDAFYGSLLAHYFRPDNSKIDMWNITELGEEALSEWERANLGKQALADMTGSSISRCVRNAAGRYAGENVRIAGGRHD